LKVTFREPVHSLVAFFVTAETHETSNIVEGLSSPSIFFAVWDTYYLTMDALIPKRLDCISVT
jgi:hypothetical protein